MYEKNILYCFAHPDDETFACGGTIAHFSAQGAKQTLYCATHGEAGKTGNPPVCTKEELGHVRAQELNQAIQILGINELILRDYGDGRLDAQPFAQLVDDIRSVLERIRPELVITFPPSGISGHKDHIVIQRATLTAVEQVSFPTKLYYIVIPESIAKFQARAVHFVPDAYVSRKIDVTPYREKIGKALRAHKTQHLSVERTFPGVIEGDFTRLRTNEFYQLVIQK
ncbi:MAG: PIG-L deacetylase family protein [Thermoactinomyces sp.]